MNTFPVSKQDELLQLLQREIEYTQQLMQSLEQEYSALAEHHAGALEKVIRDKQENIRQLELIERQREALFASTNTTTSNDLFNGDKQLLVLWGKLMSLAEKCQEKNRINGSIVELAYRKSSHALNILHGLSPKPELYDCSGHTTKQVGTRSLVLA